MNFKMLKRLVDTSVSLICTVVILVNCGSGGEKNSSHIGSKPSYYVSSFSSAEVEQEKLILLDEKNHLLLFLTLDPFSLSSSIKLPMDFNAKYLVSGAENNFVVVLSDNGFLLAKQNGEVFKPNVDFPVASNKVVGTSYDPATGRLVLQDESGAVALIKIDSNGKVSESWVGGPLFSEETFLISGAILPKGDFVVSLKGSRLAVVDFEASIAAGEWKYKATELAALKEKDEEIDWVSPVKGSTTLVMIGTKKRLATVDYSKNAIVKEVAVASEPMYFDYAIPHAIALDKDADSGQIYWAVEKGEIRNKKFVASDVSQVGRQIELSIIDSKMKYATSVVSIGESRRVNRMRLSDSLLVYSDNIGRDVSPAITPDFLVFTYPSVFGKVERRAYSSAKPESVSIEAYNSGFVIKD